MADDASARAAAAAVQERWLRERAPREARPRLLLDRDGVRWAAFRALLAARDDRPVFLAE